MKCSVKIDEKVVKELNGKIWLTGLIMTIVGAIGFGLYAVFEVFLGESFLTDTMLWASCFSLFLGVMYLFIVKTANKNALKNNALDQIELFEDYYLEQTIKNDEVTGTMKVYYKDLIKIKETENYLFLYPNKMVATAIPKSAFSSEEFSTIKLWVNSSKINNKPTDNK